MVLVLDRVVLDVERSVRKPLGPVGFTRVTRVERLPTRASGGHPFGRRRDGRQGHPVGGSLALDRQLDPLGIFDQAHSRHHLGDLEESGDPVESRHLVVRRNVRRRGREGGGHVGPPDRRHAGARELLPIGGGRDDRQPVLEGVEANRQPAKTEDLRNAPAETGEPQLDAGVAIACEGDRAEHTGQDLGPGEIRDRRVQTRHLDFEGLFRSEPERVRVNRSDPLGQESQILLPCGGIERCEVASEMAIDGLDAGDIDRLRTHGEGRAEEEWEDEEKTHDGSRRRARIGEE